MKYKRFLIFILVIILLSLFSVYYPKLTGKSIFNNQYQRESAFVISAVDGDTLDVEIGEAETIQRIRLLGINTPEKGVYYYSEAKNFLKGFNGSKVELERTVENTDQYDRLLRYVFANGVFLNKEILRKGYAHFYSYNDDKYTDELLKAEKIARDSGIGIWKRSEEECGSCIVLKKINNIDPGEFVLLENICAFDCDLNDWTIKDDARHVKTLDFVLNKQSEKRIDYAGSIWNDAHDSLYLRDKNGLLVLFYRY